MKVTLINAILALSCASLRGVAGSGFGNIEKTDTWESETTQNPTPGTGENTDIPANLMADLMQTHLKLSLNYLYTGVGYGSQLVQKPGMAKHLRELSNSHWEQGFDTLKKYLKRHGNAQSIFDHNPLDLEAQNDLTMTEEEPLDMRRPYLATLEKLVEDSKTCNAKLNTLYKTVSNTDADWAHYFEEKHEEEEERERALRGDFTTYKQMSESSLALHIFDSHF